MAFKNNKHAFHRRLHREKRWEQYVGKREQLKRDGVEDALAWQIVALDMYPLDGSPHEVNFDERVLAMYKGGISAKEAKQPPPATVNDVPEPLTIDTSEGWLDDLLPENPQPAPAPQIPDPPPPPTQHAKGGWTIFKDGVKSGNAGWDEAFAKLAAEVDPTRACGEVQALQWVFRHQITPIEHMTPDMVPDLGALGLLKWARTGQNMGDFLKTMWIKVIPDKKTMEWQSKFKDDGRELDEKMERFDEDFAKEMAA